MTKKKRTIGIIMLVIAVLFVITALNNPQMNFPWGNKITYVIYGVYSIVMIIMLIAPFHNKDKGHI